MLFRYKFVQNYCNKWCKFSFTNLEWYILMLLRKAYVYTMISTHIDKVTNTYAGIFTYIVAIVRKIMHTKRSHLTRVNIYLCYACTLSFNDLIPLSCAICVRYIDHDRGAGRGGAWKQRIYIKFWQYLSDTCKDPYNRFWKKPSSFSRKWQRFWAAWTPSVPSVSWMQLWHKLRNHVPHNQIEWTEP